MRNFVFFVISFLITSTISAGGTNLSSLPDGLYATIKTNKGEMVISLEFQKAPLTVVNFVGLAEGKIETKQKSGKKFYDGLIFHRIIKDFMIQGGDPLGTGTGGPGYKFADEFDASLSFDKKGVLAMANSGPGTNGSQFFITLAPTTWLNNKHTIFGHIVQGIEVLEAIGTVKTGAQDKPVDPITIETITITRKGKAAEAFVATQASFNELNANFAKKAKDASEKAAKDQLAQIAKIMPKAKKTETGIFYETTKAGTGAQVKAGQTVKVHYSGKLLNGTTFDSSKGREPLELSVGSGQVIAGWEQTLLAMKVGESRTVIIPPELAYGERGYPGVIPGNAYLLFEMEVISAK